MTLLELVISMSLTAVLLLGLVQVVTAAGSAARMQDSQGQLAESGRYAIELLTGLVRQTGFSPQPWNAEFEIEGLLDQTQESAAFGSDRLAIRSWSDLNCFNNRNPVKDSNGDSRFYVRETIFDLNGSTNLTHSCRYGPSSLDLSSQIHRQGLITGVESFQLLFGEDTDNDGQIERWVKPGDWQSRENILAVRIGMLLLGEEAAGNFSKSEYQVLDHRIRPSQDGRLRRVVQLMVAIRGRTG